MSSVGKIISAFFIAFCLTACSTKNVPVVTEQKRVVIDIPEQTALKMHVVNWKVVEIDNELYMVLSAKDYENLSKNIELLQARINEQRVIIVKMKDYYNH